MMGSMRGVRTMFREMPDEEPPARGLDALMAAARTKAAEMAPPERESGWRRTLAMLTRPPMLAAATVIVLVGSTVVLTRRGGMDTAATERTAREPDESQKNQATAGAKLEAREKTKDMKGTVEKPGYSGAPGAASDRPVVPPRPRPPAAIARPEPPPPPEAVADPVRVDRPTVTPTDEDEPRIVTEGGVGLHVKGPQGQDKHPPDAPKPATADSETATPSTATGSAPVSVPQLVKQAETAAGRKDCAAVKATAERIRKLDANAYKTRVVTQAAIKRCL